jgi:hypothetical protein
MKSTMKGDSIKVCFKALFCLMVLASKALAQGTILWDESVNGELSSDYTNPTQLGILSAGSNTVIGHVEFFPSGSGGGLRNDYFTFQIPAGLSLTGIGLSVDKPVLAWLGDASYSAEIGHAFTQGNSDLLPQFGIGPVAPGTYGFYMQNNDLQSPAASIANYRLDYYAQLVPEPSLPPLCVIAIGCLALLGRRRRSHA